MISTNFSINSKGSRGRTESLPQPKYGPLVRYAPCVTRYPFEVSIADLSSSMSPRHLSRPGNDQAKHSFRFRIRTFTQSPVSMITQEHKLNNNNPIGNRVKILTSPLGDGEKKHVRLTNRLMQNIRLK